MLGIGFIQDAKMILNIAQFTYQFLDDQLNEHEFKEDFFVLKHGNSPMSLNTRKFDTEYAKEPTENNRLLDVFSVATFILFDSSTSFSCKMVTVKSRRCAKIINN